jgi:hypothetical protein
VNKITGHPTKASLLDKHIYICDLINIEGPLLCLFRDHRSNWCYLWCDTDTVDTERWAVLRVSRDTLAGYLSGVTTLRQLVESSLATFCLDLTTHIEDGKRTKTRRLLQVEINALQEYFPAEDSFFDPSLTNDISLTEEIAPTSFHVPIDGDWFVSDLDRFAKTYSSVYAFFYCTKPRFVTNIEARVSKFLRSPWTGGFSRINLFDALEKTIPSIHDMKINSFQYASPGSIKIEALQSVGNSIAAAVDCYIAKSAEIDKASKAINTCLLNSKVRKANLSQSSDETLSIGPESVALLQVKSREIGDLLGIGGQLSVFHLNAPNSVVAAKATLAVVTQLERLAVYQRAGMLALGRNVDV